MILENRLLMVKSKRPTVIYSNAREKVKFERLLKLKKSFMPELFASGKERVFRQKKLLIR
jgi:hypothetical protein